MIYYTFLYICSFISIALCTEQIKANNIVDIKKIQIEDPKQQEKVIKDISIFLKALHKNPASLTKYITSNTVTNIMQNKCKQNNIPFTEEDKAWTTENATHIMKDITENIKPEQKKLLSDAMISINTLYSIGKGIYKCSGKILLQDTKKPYTIEIEFSSYPNTFNIRRIDVNTGMPINILYVIFPNISRKTGYQSFRKKIEKNKAHNRT